MRISKAAQPPRAPAALHREQPAMRPAQWPFPAPPTTQQLHSPVVELQRPWPAPHYMTPAWPAAPQTQPRSYSPAYHSCSPVGSPAGSPMIIPVLSPPRTQQEYPTVPPQHRRIQFLPGPPSPRTAPTTTATLQQPPQSQQQRLRFNVPTRTRQAARPGASSSPHTTARISATTCPIRMTMG